MNIAIIGRSEVLYNTVKVLLAEGHNIKLIITAKEAPEYIKTAHDFEHLAKEIGAKYLYAHSLKVEDIKSFVSEIDIGISYNYVNVVDKDVIDSFPYGVLNAHGGDLPKYRGNACQAWAIINGEDRVGLCIHKMVEELDAGDVIAKEYHAIASDTKVGVLLEWIEKRVPQMFLKSINLLEENKDYILYRQSKKHEDILRCYPRKPEDGRINWNKKAIDIIRLINACNKPYSGSFCFFNEKKIIIWDASIVEDNENFLAIPGQVTCINKLSGAIVIATGLGKVEINEIECDGVIGKPANVIKSMRDRLV